jgi:hypothetical protein
MPDDTKKAAVYVAWTTFKNAIEALAKAAVPNRVDKTVFPGMAGGVQSQLFAGLRFLGLIDDDSKPTTKLHGLAVQDETARKVALNAIIRESYADVFALDLVKTTPGELTERMRSAYGVGGDTAEKAVRFFLAAVSYLDIPVSPLFKTAKANGNSGTVAGAPRRRRRTAPTKTADAEPPPPNPTPASTGESRTVTLKSGGTLTLSASTGFFSLSSTDRNFVFGLIDKLEEYERQSTNGGNGGGK